MFRRALEHQRQRTGNMRRPGDIHLRRQAGIEHHQLWTVGKHAGAGDVELLDRRYIPTQHLKVAKRRGASGTQPVSNAHDLRRPGFPRGLRDMTQNRLARLIANQFFKGKCLGLQAWQQGHQQLRSTADSAGQAPNQLAQCRTGILHPGRHGVFAIEQAWQIDTIRQLVERFSPHATGNQCRRNSAGR